MGSMQIGSGYRSMKIVDWPDDALEDQVVFFHEAVLAKKAGIYIRVAPEEGDEDLKIDPTGAGLIWAPLCVPVIFTFDADELPGTLGDRMGLRAL